MKKVLKWGVTIAALLVIVFIVAGNYFYNVAVNRSEESVELYGGSDTASTLVDEEEQRKLEEVLEWTENQTFEEVKVESHDGLNLSAVLLKSEKPNGKAVILAHGYKGSNEQMPGITKFYHEQGYDVLKPDARGHGKSEGSYIGYGWDDRKDYTRWVDLLINEYGAEEVYLHGFSMGAATVLMTSGEDLPPEVKGIIADSGYTSVEEELAHQLKYLYNLPAFPLMEITSVVTNIRAGYTFSEASAVEQVKKNTLPLLIIHGDQDELVPTDMASTLYEAASGEKELWIVRGAGHTEAYTVAEEEYQRRLKEFLE
ncbi:alpha/beta hydrolase [Rossellomorea vietnamensis]|uniref:Alpha/beta hydrolase n=1 Tax=Rossellomorea vietnamensis TaxID=218284 RepID=A0A5D4NKQ3_9BACI|nr:alpha/beta hydrolase [Rossellomorea vietnamensis]TYS14459.1 alpha/beta hydrolase [Rossellomorea vietnamensis]